MKLSALLGNYDRLTDRRDGWTDRRATREVSLPIMVCLKLSAPSSRHSENQLTRRMMTNIQKDTAIFRGRLKYCNRVVS